MRKTKLDQTEIRQYAKFAAKLMHTAAQLWPMHEETVPYVLGNILGTELAAFARETGAITEPDVFGRVRGADCVEDEPGTSILQFPQTTNAVPPKAS